MNVIHESEADCYVLAPVESPTDRADQINLEGRMRGLSKSGHRSVYRGDERVGQIVDCAVWPYEHHVTLSDGGVQKAKATLPAWTGYVGMTLTEKAWAEHKAGRLPLSVLRIGKAPVSKAHHDPFTGKKDSLVDPDDGAPLTPYNDPGTDPGTPAVDFQEAAHIQPEDAAFNASLSGMTSSQAAALAVHPLMPVHRRVLLRRRANPGR